ncbi:hypothetical protein [Microbulbifer hainanensis]|uniref:hypothetical protein n=1 Tax=Microbulbifer hainanensis TaxID=2735675 RepID=UPI00186946D9|nr:hypothetical protein [Microbulbifer hainanensis]
MKRILISFVLLFFTASAGAVDPCYTETVQSLIELFRNRDKGKIADRVAYPLNRTVPIPDIVDRQTMLNRFDQVFDEELSRRIAVSGPDDWELMGWRGIMFDRGTVWMDIDGRIIAVNYQSAAEQALRKQLIAADKTHLYESLRQFDSPVLEWRTAHFHIRIDAIGDGDYRYAAWSKGRGTAEKPDIILTDGELQWDGSGGNHNYTFTNGHYRYRCYVNVIGTADMAPGDLVVSRGDQVLLHEEVLEELGR